MIASPGLAFLASIEFASATHIVVPAAKTVAGEVASEAEDLDSSWQRVGKSDAREHGQGGQR